MSKDEPLDDAVDLTPTEGTIPEGYTVEDPVAEEPEVPAALRDIDPEKLRELKEKLAKFVKGKGTTESGSEAPVSPGTTEAPQAEPATLPTGRDIDWDEYDLDFNIKHLYPRAVARPIQDGSIHWIAMIDEFYTTNRAGKQHGKMVHNPNDKDPDSKTEPLNLGEFLTAMTNGPEGWKIAALLPCGSETTVVLQRQVPYQLPDPKPLKTMDTADEEVEVPTDEELARTEQAALDFAAEEGLTPPEIEQEEPEKLGTMHGQPLSPEEEHKAVRDALTLNQGVTEEAPAGEQPEAFETEQPWFGQTQVPAGIVNIAAGLDNILKGGDFGEV